MFHIKTAYFNNKEKYNKYITFLFCCVTVLTLGFYNNFWNAANQKWFDGFQYDSESLIVGKLILADQDGILAQGGLLGRFHKIPEVKDINLYQYDIYKNNLDIDNLKFNTYNSQTGGQAFIFVLLDSISPFSNITNIKIFKLLTSILTAFVFSLILLWFFENFGLGTALIILTLILFSQWITVFGRNLYWGLWSFYIPFITVLTILSIENKKNYFLSLKKLFGLVYLSVFLKCFFSGFEYITTTLIMLVTPFTYYAILDKWDLRILFKRIIFTAFGSICAILSLFAILTYQISIVKDSVIKGFEHIWESFVKRTYGNSSDYPELIKESFNSRIHDVLIEYWNGIAIDFNNIFINSLRKELLKIEFGELILLFAIFSGLSLALSKLSNTNISNKKRNIALIATCWFSILAPLSWLILFKSHSYIHTHMNCIVWYMPFALFGYALIGIAILWIFNFIITIYLSMKKLIMK